MAIILQPIINTIQTCSPEAHGFLTSETSTNINQITGEEMMTVFIPTTPNPTSGFLVIVPKNKARELSMSIEEAFKIIVSLGTLKTDDFASHFS